MTTYNAEDVGVIAFDLVLYAFEHLEAEHPGLLHGCIRAAMREGLSASRPGAVRLLTGLAAAAAPDDPPPLSS